MRNLSVFILLFFMISLVWPDTAANTMMPFNPVDYTEEGDVIQLSYNQRYNGVLQMSLTVLALKKARGSLAAVEEDWWRTSEEVNMSTYELQAGTLSVYDYVNDFLGIELPASAKVEITSVPECDCTMSNDGKLKLSVWDGGKNCYMLRFNVSGDKVPFIGDDDIQVAAVLFLNKDVPLFGLRNARYFPLIRSGGKWIRTGATQWVQFTADVFYSKEIARERGAGSIYMMTTEELLRRRPSTMLTDYIIAEDNSTGYRESGVSTANLETGEWVLAPSDDGYWYPATISTVSTNKIQLFFANPDKNDIFDDSGNFFSPAELKPFFWKEGTKIWAKREYSGKYQHATVREIDWEDEMVRVFYDDTDIPVWVSMGDCRGK